MRRAAIATVIVIAACGGTSANPVAEPGSTALAKPPAGQVVSVGGKPEGIAYDAATGILAVGVRSPDAVLFLDRDGHLLKRVDVSAAPRHVTLAASGGPLLVPAERAGELDVVAMPSGDVSDRVRVGRQPHDATAVNGRFFVTNEFSDTVSVVQGSEVVANLASPAQPGGIAATSMYVGVLGVRSHQLELIDAGSLSRITSAPAGAGPTHLVADARNLYVVDTNGGALLAFAAGRSLQRLYGFPLAGKPYGIAIDAGRGRLWITETASNSIAEIAIGGATPKLVATFASVREPNTVAVDTSTGRVFVTGTGDGVIQILDPPA